MSLAVQLILALFVALFSSGCTNEKDKAIKEFGERYLQAQRDFTSTNIFVAEKGLENFRGWLLGTNHIIDPVLNRDLVLYQVNGRLFLIEEQLGDTNQAENLYQESVAAYAKFLRYEQEQYHSAQPHPLEPISSKDELRARLAQQDRRLAVGWKK